MSSKNLNPNENINNLMRPQSDDNYNVSELNSRVIAHHKTLATERKGKLILEVIDTGCGMTSEETKRLFQPFVQANNSVHSKYGGTGLGLWLSYKLIKAMNGIINCKSELNKGTKFTIELGVKYNNDPQSFTPSLFKGFLTICFFNCDRIKELLANLGCKVASCKRIEEAVSIIKDCKSKGNQRFVVMSDFSTAYKLKNISESEFVTLKYSQIIIITSIFHSIL